MSIYYTYFCFCDVSVNLLGSLLQQQAKAHKERALCPLLPFSVISNSCMCVSMVVYTWTHTHRRTHGNIWLRWWRPCTHTKAPSTLCWLWTTTTQWLSGPLHTVPSQHPAISFLFPTMCDPSTSIFHTQGLVYPESPRCHGPELAVWMGFKSVFLSLLS